MPEMKYAKVMGGMTVNEVAYLVLWCEVCQKVFKEWTDEGEWPTLPELVDCASRHRMEGKP